MSSSVKTIVHSTDLLSEQSSRIAQKGRSTEGVTLVLVLVLALVLRLWGLDRNGWGAEYYTAAVRSMAMSWHNFLYNAFDPAGFISVDKPPVAIWLQVVSVKLLGFRPFSVLLPQVVEGVGSVGLLFHLVRRRFGSSAGFLSALFLAITPVWVAVNRTNNTDSCLLLVLLLAAWALLKAAEEGNSRLLFLSAALIGLAFNVKMLAAYIVLPTFFIVYFFGAPQHWQRRLIHLGMATIVVVATSLPWVLTYEFTPAKGRPFVGSSHRNSMLELVVGHNAMNRFVSPAKYSRADAHGQGTLRGTNASTESPLGLRTDSRTFNEWSRLFVRTPTGPLRLADGQLAAQAGWLFPFVAIALVLGACQNKFRRPLTTTHLSLLFWGCWIFTYAGVYSYLGGIMHSYYLATMAPALAALAGIGIISLWTNYRQRNRYTGLLPLALLVTAVWQLYIQASALGWSLDTFTGQPASWQSWLHGALIGGIIAATAGLIFILFRPFMNQATRVISVGSLTLGLLALLVVPSAWTLSTVLLPTHGLLPSADLYRVVAAFHGADADLRSRFGRFADTSRLVGFLKANRKGERYLIATSTAQLAAPIIIDTGQPVMARGGFHGLDPAVTPETLAQMVAAKQVRFVMIGDVAIVSLRMGARTAGKPVADWVRANGKLVDPTLWRTIRTRDSMQLYDLRPEAGLVPTPLIAGQPNG